MKQPDIWMYWDLLLLSQNDPKREKFIYTNDALKSETEM